MIADTDNQQPTILYVTALGESAYAFLQSHFTALLNEGYDVALACSPDNYVQQILTREPRLKFYPLPMMQGIDVISDLKSFLVFSKIIKLFRPVIVHSHMSKASFLATLASSLHRTPVRIYHNHGMALFSAKGASRLLLTIIERVTCKLATDIIFCSNSTRETAIKMNLCNEEKSLVIGHGTISGISEKHFIDKIHREDRKKLINQLGLPVSDHYALFVGRIVKHKGVAELMVAWQAQPSAIHSKWTLVFAGDNNNDEIAKDLKQLSDSRLNIVYVGFQKNIENYYKISDLLVLPSWHEGFPYSVLEAQAAGVPALVTNVTGNTDAVIEGLNGCLTPANDINALAETLTATMRDIPKLIKMGERAKLRIKSYFTEEMVIENLKKLYSEHVVPRVMKNYSYRT